MPNLPSTQDQFTQNGHSRNRQDFTKERLDSKNSEPLTQSKSSELQDDWSPWTQELIDSLPRVWTRGLLYFLIVFAGIVLPWAMLAKVDETGSARGRLEPKGQTFELDAPVGGTVAAIKVKEGQTVKAGQILLELESELPRAELQQAQAKLEGQLNRLPQLELIKNQLEMTARTQRLQAQAQSSGQLAQISAVRQQITFNKTASDLAHKLLAKDQNTVQRYQKYHLQGVVPRIQVDEAERTMLENQERLQKAQSDIKQAQDELKKQQSIYDSNRHQGELAVMESERQIKQLQAQIAELQAEITQSKKQINSLKFQLQQRLVRASVDGTIFRLPVPRGGAVLQPGEMIAQIAPKGVPLVLRAQMTSKESGFLRVGMPVKLKFDAYPFQDYGIIEGHLSSISPDSKITQTAQGPVETFELEIALAQTYIQTKDKRISLTPGQSATAEVIVRQRRVIDFILDPFKKLQKGGLKL
ncbi:MAG TPA: HlyD family efflux transporter periplasmic adaptor subunit [Waterburya sp.]|jgi:HlyD family secretion protein